MKFSLMNPWDDREETVELDDDLAGKVQETVDNDPDLTLAEVLRQGLQRIVEERSGGGRA
ncbi:hypothetical protein [Blastococcus sp. TF02A-30]|uniref:hypothetical protein n=1 Tax=Blastococcus sp. TF02A-30 TaxID=2250580 RepID=UPI000DFE099A|nr:hypothetical protein [Blastococcus sp. TF02A-30]RBY83435.1 hypothetical protein DQ241_19315 [Blastococcus sp. TF02A-30]